MNSRLAITVGALALAAIGVGISQNVVRVNETKEEQDGGPSRTIVLIGVDLPPVATVEVKTGPSMMCRLPDAGRCPRDVAPYQTDAGIRWLQVAVSDPGCCRRSLGGSAALCSRGTSILNMVDYGQLNRFPCSEAQPVVNTCEHVACAVHQGENSDIPESDLLGSIIGIVIGPGGIIPVSDTKDAGVRTQPIESDTSPKANP